MALGNIIMIILMFFFGFYDYALFNMRFLQMRPPFVLINYYYFLVPLCVFTHILYDDNMLIIILSFLFIFSLHFMSNRYIVIQAIYLLAFIPDIECDVGGGWAEHAGVA